MRRQKLLHIRGDRQNEPFDPTAKLEDLITIEDTYPVNGEIERQSLQGVGGDYCRYPTEPSIVEVLPRLDLHRRACGAQHLTQLY